MSVTTVPQALVIEGGNPLNGRIRASGNKNGALPIIAACLLADEPVTLANVPRIRDVETMLDLVCATGANAEWTGPNEVRVDPEGLSSYEVDAVLAERIRASFLLAGPLLARFGHADMPPPGGDVIGRRRLDPHLDAFRALGAEVNVDRSWFRLAAPDGLHACDFFMDEPSVMATENALMAAALTPGSTVIHNAASEPHVQDLARLLMAMGARIEGIGSNVLTIHGGAALHGADFTLGPDFMEVGSFIVLSAVTDGEVLIEGVRREDLRMPLNVFGRLGIATEYRGDDLFVSGARPLVIQSDLGDAIPKVDDGPWPAFPADLMSVALVAATQAEGAVLFHEKMYESRLFFVDRLIGMGARIVLCDPHRALIHGPARLRGEPGGIPSPDIRAGIALLIAALCADGRTVIRSIEQIDRGYEDIETKLQGLGAKITRR
jgi:UDP-N-acetylglucosamine 1-carboxyvinyltransferase